MILNSYSENIKERALSSTSTVSNSNHQHYTTINLNKETPTSDAASAMEIGHTIDASHQLVLIEKHGGLSNRKVLFICFIWYLFSALTLFTNKYIVTYAKGNPTIIGKKLKRELF